MDNIDFFIKIAYYKAFLILGITFFENLLETKVEVSFGNETSHWRHSSRRDSLSGIEPIGNFRGDERRDIPVVSKTLVFSRW